MGDMQEAVMFHGVVDGVEVLIVVGLDALPVGTMKITNGGRSMATKIASLGAPEVPEPCSVWELCDLN